MLWRLPGGQCRAATPPPARLVTQPPTGTGRSSHKPTTWENKHSTFRINKTRGSFSELFINVHNEIFFSILCQVSKLEARPCAQRARVAAECDRAGAPHVSDHTTLACQHLHSQRVKLMRLKFNAGFMKGYFAYLTTEGPELWIGWLISSSFRPSVLLTFKESFHVLSFLPATEIFMNEGKEEWLTVPRQSRI